MENGFVNPVGMKFKYLNFIFNKVYKKFLILIERSDEFFPAAETLTKICDYVDAVSSLIDGIGKYEGKKDYLEKICKNFGIKANKRKGNFE